MLWGQHQHSDPFMVCEDVIIDLIKEEDFTHEEKHRVPGRTVSLMMNITTSECSEAMLRNIQNSLQPPLAREDSEVWKIEGDGPP